MIRIVVENFFCILSSAPIYFKEFTPSEFTLLVAHNGSNCIIKRLTLGIIN